MKNQINISNLTPEQIEDLRQQLKAFDEQPKSIMDEVKSWEDAGCIVKPEYHIKNDEIFRDSFSAYSEWKTFVPSEKHAKSILATCQLMVIAEALNEGSINNIIGIYWNGKKFEYYKDPSIWIYGVIRFKTKEIAEYAITQFPELWYDYFMIDKPE